jgi:iron(III) transport system ATP-binding protein
MSAHDFAISARSLEKRFGAVVAASDINVDIPAGAKVSLIGSNGAGKTTFVNMITGYIKPDSGQILLHGENIAGLAPRSIARLGVARSFQIPQLFKEMTVFDNMLVAIASQAGGLSFLRPARNAAAQERATELLERFELSAHIHRTVGELPGGVRKLLDIAMALTRQPKVLLLDEPLSNLDAQLRLRLRDDLRRIIKAAGLTALYVTHDQLEAVVLGDRIGVMQNGKLLQMAPPEEVYNRPADLFVASFTGASNFLPGRLRDRQGESGTVEVAGGLVMQAWCAQGLAPGAAVTVAIRPENIRLEAVAAENRFETEVVSQRFQGVQTAYALRLGATTVEALATGTTMPHPAGSRVAINIPPQTCWAYPAQ